MVSYSIAALIEAMERSIHTYRPKYLFLAGTGRSGTTVLRKSLGVHPRIYYNGHENNIIQDIIDVAKINAERPSRKFAMVVDESEYCSSFRGLIHRLIWNDEAQQTKPVWMAAINPNPETLDFIHRIFPNAKVIGLVRNGIDVILSRQRYESFQHLSFEAHCRTWLRSKWVFDWGARHPEHFLEFRYEWLNSRDHSRKRFQQIWKWLNLEPSEEPWRHTQVNRYHPTRINFDSPQKQEWCNWTASEREAFVEICENQMDRFGYTVPFAKNRAA